MMDPIFYVLAIMGCADGNDQCAEARVEAPRYASIQACQAAMPAALQRSSDLSYPVIAATCRQTGTRFASRDVARRVSSPAS